MVYTINFDLDIDNCFEELLNEKQIEDILKDALNNDYGSVLNVQLLDVND